MKRTILTYLLLISFFVISLPKGLWHDHELHAEHNEKKSHLHDNSSLDGDCFVCDFALQPATEVKEIKFNFSYLNYYQRPSNEVLFAELPTTEIRSLRAPPAHS